MFVVDRLKGKHDMVVVKLDFIKVSVRIKMVDRGSALVSHKYIHPSCNERISHMTIALSIHSS